MFAFLIIALIVVQEADYLKDAPAITEEQEKIIKRMGDDEFQVRQKASADLLKLDYTGLKAMHKAANHEDLEIRRRAKRVLEQYYSVQNSKDETPGIQGLYEMKSFKFKSGKVVEFNNSDANDYYKAAGGDAEDMTERQDATNFKTREATFLLVKKLRNKGYTKEEIKELLDKITEEAAGTNMGDAGYKKFREMQGLPEYEPWGPEFVFGLNPLPGLRNFFIRSRFLLN